MDNDRLKKLNLLTESDRLQKQLTFLMEIDKMKNVMRQTVLTDKSRQETDAEHSWHFAMMAMLLYEYTDTDKVDLNRVIRMALVHDLIEIYAGDTFAYDIEGNKDKEDREKKAADRLFSILPLDQGEEIRTLWEEFDAMETQDAIYASAIDRLQPLVINFITEGHTWKRGVTYDQVYERNRVVKEASPSLWKLINELLDKSVELGYLKK